MFHWINHWRNHWALSLKHVFTVKSIPAKPLNWALQGEFKILEEKYTNRILKIIRTDKQLISLTQIYHDRTSNFT